MNNEQIIKTARANPQIQKFQLGIKSLIEEMMIQRMGENDKIVTRYMDDAEFQNSAFPILAREIFERVKGSPLEGRSSLAAPTIPAAEPSRGSLKS